jgi:hypothetical protein
MMGEDDGLSEIPPSGKPKLTNTGLLGHPVNPPRHGQVGKCNIQAFVRNKRYQMHIFNGFDDQSDTYHDTQTNYLKEQELSLTQDQADGDGCCCLLQDKDVGRKKRWALQGHAKVNPALGTLCLGPVGLET